MVGGGARDDYTLEAIAEVKSRWKKSGKRKKGTAKARSGRQGVTRDKTCWTCCERGAEETVPTVQQVGERDGSHREKGREGERETERVRNREKREPEIDGECSERSR